MKKHTHTAPGIEEFKKLLKKHSLKSTQQRLAVHNAMLKLGHASADMVTEEIRSQGTTNVTVASVYNILSQIALLGIYDHRMSANNKMYFDVNTFRHIHLYDYVNNTFKDVIMMTSWTISTHILPRKSSRDIVSSVWMCR